MSGPYGVTAGGFVVKPLSQILLDIETAQLATMNPAIDLSPTGPQGQLNLIHATNFYAMWLLTEQAYNSFNRQAVVGAALDNLGDITGTRREGGSYTQVPCRLVFTSGAVGNTYAAGTLVANVLGNTSAAFTNAQAIVVTATTMPGVTMQSLVIGATPAVAAGTLTVITNPVSGWVSITNAAQSQLGSNAELDAAYVASQASELAGEGSCNPPATVAAIIAVGAAQTPPTTPVVTLTKNTASAPLALGALTLPKNTYAIVIWPDPATWEGGNAVDAVGAAIWANKPSGIGTVGTTPVVVNDPYLGQQTVSYTVPTQEPLYVSATIVIRTGAAFTFTPVSNAVQAALVAASTAATPVNGTPPNGQLAPGADVIGSQLEAVIMGVPGVYDLQALTFGLSPSPSTDTPIVIAPTSIATLTGANIVITQGTGP